MNLISEIKLYLKERLSDKRYHHCLRVMKLSGQLAERYGADISKAELAGILHDAAKENEEELLKAYDISDIIPLEDIDKYKSILHGPLSREVARNVFGIEDDDILSAIAYHVTGRENMSLIEKIVFIADAAEPGRKYGNAAEINKLAFVDLDNALIEVFNSKIEYCIKKNSIIHPLSVDSRNFYILEKEIRA
ncbi:MAG: bis(5'-nucleosyl)-tetraphosphatase (symmetrical) YqeK [Tissierellia bacterium]|nr:bis(5'-nucleosyl)-tetraphosphatase (symmetrical) YqeK [Tissierellia bacterium]